MSLYGDIASLPCNTPDENDSAYEAGYGTGHSDAKHAAAELALKADARIAELEAALRMLDDAACTANRNLSTPSKELDAAVFAARSVLEKP